MFSGDRGGKVSRGAILPPKLEDDTEIAACATARFALKPAGLPARRPARGRGVRLRLSGRGELSIGRVIGVEDDAALVIDFGSRQVRIMTPFAKLTRL